MNAQVSALPSAMQAKLDAAKAAETNPAASNDPPVDNSQAPNPPADTSNSNSPPAAGERVTLGRDEYNDLKAAQGKLQTMEGRLQLASDRFEEMQQRLTELESSNKGNPNPSTPAAPASSSAPAVDVSGIQITDEEKEKFGDSADYITKVAKLAAAEMVNQLLPNINNTIEDLRNQTKGIGTQLQTEAQRTFAKEVSTLVPNFKELILHKNWGDFLDEVEPMSGDTYDQVLVKNVQKGKAQQVANVYKAFSDKYVKPIEGNPGYAGAAPSGGATNLPPDPNASKEKLKLSDRKKASDDYKKGRIKWEDLEKVNKAFDEAEKAGNVDYNS
jgi:hypothetical protein